MRTVCCYRWRVTRDAARICCLDLDTFFVSVERLLDPSLVDQPVVVGGLPGQRGVVTAASYEVRAFGVRSGMSLTQAQQLAPHAIYLPTRHDVYGDYSSKVREIAAGFSPVVQMASIDEMYIDFGGCELLYRRPGDADADAAIERTVRELTARVAHELGLPSSAGIATSRQMAKVACGLAKPAGVLMVPAGAERQVLAPLPVRKYPGVGPVAEQKLLALGIGTLGQLAEADDRELARIFGSFAPALKLGAQGHGNSRFGRERPAFQEHDPEGQLVGSISNERTFREDVSDSSSIEAQLCSLCERVCYRARKRGIKARTVSVKLRYADFVTLTRSRTLTPTHSELELFPVVHQMFLEARTRRTPIRLLGLALSNLGHYDEQLSLFADRESLHRAMDCIRHRFGYDSLRLALPASRKQVKTIGGSGRRGPS